MNRFRHEFGDVGENCFNALSLSSDKIFRQGVANSYRKTVNSIDVTYIQRFNCFFDMEEEFGQQFSRFGASCG
jgi:hypothetical protein